MFCYARTRDGRVCNKTATETRTHDRTVILRMCRVHANTYDEWIEAERAAALTRILRGRSAVAPATTLTGATTC